MNKYLSLILLTLLSSTIQAEKPKLCTTNTPVAEESVLVVSNVECNSSGCFVNVSAPIKWQGTELSHLSLVYGSLDNIKLGGALAFETHNDIAYAAVKGQPDILAKSHVVAQYVTNSSCPIHISSKLTNVL